MGDYAPRMITSIMESLRLSELDHLAREYGLVLETHRPGDGIRRYRFTRPNGLEVLLLGAREATIWLRGYMAATQDCSDVTYGKASIS